MTVLIYLVPMALLLGLTGLAAFLWSLRSGQYDDVDGAAVRILDDDDIDRAKTDARSDGGRANETPRKTLAGRHDTRFQDEAVSRP